MLKNISLLLILITTFSCVGDGKIKLDEALNSVVAPTTIFSNSLSSVSLDTANLLANGVAASTVTVTLKDTKGDPITGVGVILNSNRPTLDTISPFYVITDSSGVASFTVKSSYSGTSIYTAVETKGNASVLQTASVTFTTVPVSAAQSSVSASLTSVTADGVATSSVMVFLLDASGNPVVGKTVTLTSSRPANDTISPASGVTNSVGLVNFAVKSTVMGSSTYTAYDDTDSLSIMPSVAVVNYIPGPPALISIDSGNNQTRTVALALSSVIRVKVTDSTLNNVTGATVNWAIASGGGSLSAASSTTNSSGLAQIAWTMGQTAGTNTVTATINGTSTSTTFTATGVAGATAKYRVSGFPTSATAGTSYNFTVTAQDAYNNTVTTNNSVMTITSSDSSAVLSAPGALSSGVGTFNATLNKFSKPQWIRASGSVSGAQTGITVVPTASTAYELDVVGVVTSFNSSTCQTFTINVLNNLGALINSTTTFDVDLYEAFGTFYSDSACTTIVNSVQVASGQSSKDFYYKNFFNQAAGPIAVFDRNQILQPASIGITITSGTVGNIAAIVTSNLSYHNYALLDNGLVWGFGLSDFNNLLNNSHPTSVIYPVPLKNLGGPVTSIASGLRHNCALLSTGTVKCWGNNQYGELGNNSTAYSSVPVFVSGISTATAISLGEYHSCARLSDSTVKCWGLNSNGQLGNNTAVNSSIPVTVSGISTATAISLGSYHSCARLSDSTLRCWGSNGDGQLGNNSSTQSLIPVTVSGISTATLISIGARHSCARLSDSTLRCWGNGYYGQLGNNTSGGSSIPVTVSGINTATTITSGAFHSCALLSNSTLRCWGYNYSGELGNNSTTNAFMPVTVSGISTATSVSLGTQHSCARLSDSTLKCWGSNYYGQLGIGLNTRMLLPTSALGLTIAPATKLQFVFNNSLYLTNTTSIELYGGSCNSFEIFRTTNSFNFATASSTNTTIELNESGYGVDFYSDSSCNDPVSSLEMPAGLHSVKGYLKSRNDSSCSSTPDTIISAESSDGTLVSPNKSVFFYQGCGGS